MDLVVVDGPNLFNTVLNVLDEAHPREEERVKDYLRNWFDFDRLIGATIGLDPARVSLGVVLFHSLRSLGRGEYRLSGAETDAFWLRQSANPNSSSIQVVIPGDQRETYPFKCNVCGEKTDLTSTSEKGVDTSIATYLFETSTQWKSACIFSKDVDFVPPVQSLRRQGKRMFCATDATERPTALVQACQSNYDLAVGFVRDDYATYTFFTRGGPLDRIVAALTARGEDFAVLTEQNSGFYDPLHVFHKQNGEDALWAIIFEALGQNLAAAWQWMTVNRDRSVVRLRDSFKLTSGPSRHLERVGHDAAWREYVKGTSFLTSR